MEGEEQWKRKRERDREACSGRFFFFFGGETVGKKIRILFFFGRCFFRFRDRYGMQ